MKLFIKRDVSVNDSAFTVFDECGKEKYYSLISKNKSKTKITITDTKNNIVSKMHQMPFFNTETFLIKSDKCNMTLVVIMSSKGLFCKVYGINWHIAGDIANKNFSILDVDNSVIATHKNSMNYAELMVYDKSNELSSIALSLCINMINTVDNRVAQAV